MAKGWALGAPKTTCTAGPAPARISPDGPRSGPRAGARRRWPAPPGAFQASSRSALHHQLEGEGAVASYQPPSSEIRSGELEQLPPPRTIAAANITTRCRLDLREVAPGAARRPPPRQASPTTDEQHRRQGERRPARSSSRRGMEGPPPPTPRGLCPAAHAGGGGRGGRREGLGFVPSPQSPAGWATRSGTTGSQIC